MRPRRMDIIAPSVRTAAATIFNHFNLNAGEMSEFHHVTANAYTSAFDAAAASRDTDNCPCTILLIADGTAKVITTYAELEDGSPRVDIGGVNLSN